MTSLISLTSAELMSWIGAVWWPFVRLSALLWAMPAFDNPGVPPRARILLAVFLSFLLAPLLPAMPTVDPFSLDSAVITFEQIGFGIMMGLAVRMLFEVLMMSGMMLSMQMGLSMATMMDPATGDSAPLLGHLFWMMGALLFFALGGHLLVLAVLVDSFLLWPVGTSLYQLNITVLLQMFGWMFGAALLVALPGVVAMLLVNLTFGIATRAAPSLNIFVLGFPMNMVLGFVCVYLTVVQTGHRFSGMITEMLDNLYLLMG
jgi:flagellar biosynthetic protein FliR